MMDPKLARMRSATGVSVKGWRYPRDVVCIAARLRKSHGEAGVVRKAGPPAFCSRRACMLT
jgi:hypothetical protein